MVRTTIVSKHTMCGYDTIIRIYDTKFNDEKVIIKNTMLGTATLSIYRC